MREAHKELGIRDEDFVMPEGVIEVEIDSDTKLLPRANTRNTEKEIFFKSNRPTN